MKERVTYITICRNCDFKEMYIMRDSNVNPMSDEAIFRVIKLYEQNPRKWNHCENCELYTLQEVAAFDYYEIESPHPKQEGGEKV